MPSRFFLQGAALALASLSFAAPARAQVFDSGSDGSDGELTFAPSLGTIQFDPSTLVPPRDADGDGVYHFTTITVGVGTTLRLDDTRLGEGKPVVWLAQGAVLIAGTLNLSGGSTQAGPNPTPAGAGGYRGGRGQTAATTSATAGNGPGGGAPWPTPGLDAHARGGTAGHAFTGGLDTVAAPGEPYGNPFLLPLVGGSGGGGGGMRFAGTSGSAGGAGGGALLIASSTSIRVTGTITCAGGSNAEPTAFAGGGGGSGGAIRLIAPRLEGSGTLDVNGGLTSWSNVRGGPGRIRLESYRNQATFTLVPTTTTTEAPPGPVFPPATAPAVRVVRVDGVAVATGPTGSFDAPDVVIAAAGPVTVELEARNVPAGTVLGLSLQPAAGTVFTATSSPLVAGAPGAPLTASATVTLPSGHTRVFVTATWTP
jgi:hypothetical protein